MTRFAVRPVEMQASHLKLSVEPRSNLRHHPFLQAPGEISVEEAEVGHEGWLARVAKFLASGSMSFPQWSGKRRANEKAAKVLFEEVNLFQTDDKVAEAGGQARGLANQLRARTHQAPQQGHVRGEFRCAKLDTQALDDPREEIAHVSCRH
jgi:hypothetical protein